MKGYLVLRLEGVLQSWGERSHWNQRDTALFPTKSGVVGLLGCAFKYDRGNPELKRLSDGLSVVVRADRKGFIIEDYHIVTGEPMICSVGTKRSVGNTIVTNRQYLQDAAFTVFLIGETDVLESVKEALDKPGWPVYLGRKCCIPSRPVLDGGVRKFVSVEEMLRDTGVSEREEKEDTFFVEADASLVNDGVRYVRQDRLVADREYCSRDVVRFLWHCPVWKEE